MLFDDDYDYSQHLRVRGAEGADFIPADPEVLAALAKQKAKEAGPGPDSFGAAATVTGTVGLEIPSDLLASTVEEDVGLLNRAAPHTGPRLDWDPEVVAALDDDFDHDDPENVLDDDFILQAEALDLDGSEGADFSSDEADEDPADLFGNRFFHRAETDTIKSRFTEYSMTSSILPRSEVQQVHEERFEKLYEQ